MLLPKKDSGRVMHSVNPAQLASLINDKDSLSGLFDELPLGVAVMDPHGTVLMINKAYETLTGVGREHAVGLKCLHALRCDYCVKGCPVMFGWDQKKGHKSEANIISRSREKIFEIGRAHV